MPSENCGSTVKAQWLRLYEKGKIYGGIAQNFGRADGHIVNVQVQILIPPTNLVMLHYLI